MHTRRRTRAALLVTSGKALSWFLWLLWACESVAPIIHYTRCFVCAAPPARRNSPRAKVCERTREDTNTRPAAQSIPVQLSVWSWQLFSWCVHTGTMAACHKWKEKDLTTNTEAQAERNSHTANQDLFISAVVFIYILVFFVYLLCKSLIISTDI